jgi:hypothetical protein
MRGEVNQVTAINKWNYLHASRQNAVIQLLDFRVDSREGFVCVRASTQQHNPRNHIVVIDDPAVFAMNSPGELAEPNLGALRDDRNIFYSQGSAILCY